MVPIMADPGGRPRRLLSWSVMDEAQPSLPRRSHSMGALMPNAAVKSNFGMVASSGEKFGGVWHSWFGSGHGV